MVRGTITNPKFYLNLYDANPTNLSYSQSLWAWPKSKLGGGEGFDRFDPITQQGSSWNFKTGR